MPTRGLNARSRNRLRAAFARITWSKRLAGLRFRSSQQRNCATGRRSPSIASSLPGYVFVEMDLDNDLWHVIKNTPRVTGFLGTGDSPVALSETEVASMLNRADVSKDKPAMKVKFDKGEQVRINEGPFTNFNGAVDDVNEEKQTLKVMVSIFGRPHAGRDRVFESRQDGRLEEATGTALSGHVSVARASQSGNHACAIKICIGLRSVARS